ncbi:MAG TPA: DUF4214 domain-containing protein, partial [Candidatus Dormibacteraeota bacterium]|nr:DUF4214 domain-containing protein [Candidatus Dormibacteraeota bacterium]
MLVTLLAAVVRPGGVHADERIVPAGMVARTYTEGLGRAPDPAEWERALHEAGDDCSPPRLARWGESLLDGREFAALPYDDGARLLAAHRAVLERDPDPAEWRRWLHRLHGGTPWAEVVASLYESAEFRSLAATTLCRRDRSSGDPGHHGPDGDPLVRPPAGPGPSTEAELRAALHPGGTPAPPGTVVALAAGSTLLLGAPVDVPPGVTLETAGPPPLNAYAAMARLVRDRPDDQYGPVVILEPGATLSHVWIDGNGGDPAAHPAAPGTAGENVDVDTRPGAEGATVVASRLENASAGGFTTIHLAPSDAAGPRCGSVRPALVAGNLITGYSGDHAAQRWRDGISVGCEVSRVTGNEVVDATDAAIVVFRPVLGSQSSVIDGNRILAAGSSAFAGLAADPLGAGTAPPLTSCAAESFAGTWFHDNVLFTGPDTRFDLAVALGT